ncbi:hypothetical protein [Vibrio mangrovi]|uniref:Uncharacterized protein n=1 Tax=Vibrio mangrovi TaxID=474394 RepID=A0A1Y6ITP3_9VIBR|nr:hypothetical protein [Vibrio mangrovi]MDW6004713.1 hypothetical protein [Vibrio mangrovi]SMS01004.1 hypothetical protein VIM7927_02281 [Vibrio mangrovi]
MKVIQKSDQALIGFFETANAEQDVVALGYDLDECDFVLTQSEQDRQYLQFLASTDWQVTRHRDQQEMGTETALSDADYQTLLTQRQKARDAIVDPNALASYRQIFS